MNLLYRSVAGLAIASAVALVGAQVTSAHEVRTIADGKYELVVGFSTEPAFTGERNGLDLYVYDLSQATPAAEGSDEEAAGAPVEGLEETLTAEIIYGDQTLALPIEGRWQSPGEYDAWVIPTAPGDYTFHISGTINGTAIDETFTSSPQGFGAVADRASIEFPKATAGSTTAPTFGSVSASDDNTARNLLGGALALMGVALVGSWLMLRHRTAEVGANV